MKRKKILFNRESKRRYPPKICKKSGCGKEFIPSDARQDYCCEQHRIDHNNDLRKVKQARLVEFNLKLLKNEAVLEKAYQSVERYNLEAINMDVLLNDGFDPEVLNGIEINESTGNQIYWSLDYGIEGYDKSLKTFKIRKKARQ